MSGATWQYPMMWEISWTSTAIGQLQFTRLFLFLSQLGESILLLWRCAHPPSPLPKEIHWKFKYCTQVNLYETFTPKLKTLWHANLFFTAMTQFVIRDSFSSLTTFPCDLDVRLTAAWPWGWSLRCGPHAVCECASPAGQRTGSGTGSRGVEARLAAVALRSLSHACTSRLFVRSVMQLQEHKIYVAIQFLLSL